MSSAVRPTERGGTVTSLKGAAGLFKMGAPMHPIFVHFTIALTASSLAFDALGFFTGRASLTAAGGWTLVGSALLSLLTISTGLTSATRAPVEEGEARSFLRAHMALGLIFYGLLVALTLWRLSLWQAGAGVSWWYLAAMGAGSLVMTVQGYLGGELVYRYGVEVEQAYRVLPDESANSAPPSLTSSSPRPTSAAAPPAENRGGAA
ncbi:MAG TPA: DUF2231 domain-containing protein [Pyrinomonadaceae bacterium]|nr:DUF2231 domain-containing protein [Pyrinomonadaceae bacterium]